MNREQRRKYDRNIKHVKNASICPSCNHLAMFVATNRGYPPESPNDTKTENDTVVKCERCGVIVRDDPIIAKILPQGMYLPTTLEVFDKAMKMEKEKPQDENVYINEDGTIETEGSVA